MSDSRADIAEQQRDSIREGDSMSYIDTSDTDRETFSAWSARIVDTVRELEDIAAYAELASYAVPVATMWADVRPGLTRCEQCGHFVLASGRCISCEVETVK